MSVTRPSSRVNHDVTSEPAAVVHAGEPLIPRFFWLVASLGLTLFVLILLRPVDMGRVLVSSEDVVGEQEAGQADAGSRLYLSSGCGECHTTSGADSALGPALAGVSLRAVSRIAEPDYGGTAATSQAYLVESILSHCVDRLAGYDCPEIPDLALRLSLEDAEALADFLARLPAEATP